MAKKARSAAQKAATAKMLAANRANKVAQGQAMAGFLGMGAAGPYAGAANKKKAKARRKPKKKGKAAKGASRRRRQGPMVPVVTTRSVKRKKKDGSMGRSQRTTVQAGHLATGKARERTVSRLRHIPATSKSAKLARKALSRGKAAPLVILPGYMRRKRGKKA